MSASLRSPRFVGPLVMLAMASTGACGGIVVFAEGEGGGGEGGAPGVTSSVVVVSSSSSSSVVSSSASVDPVGGGGPGLTETVLGVGVSEGPFEVTVDAQTLGVTAQAVGPSDFTELSFDKLTAPSGSVVFDGFLPSNQAAWTFYGTMAMATPQISHPEVFPLAQGTWTFDFSASSTANVSVWTRRTTDGQFHGGVLDVNVYLPGQIVDQPYVLARLAEAYDDFGGVELGDVRFFDIPPEFAVVDDNNVFDLVHLSVVQPTRPALNVFAVSSIEGGLEGAAGFALGVPGTPLLPGEEQSAVVWMALYDDFFDPIILRHEAGHFAGLFHTSEFEGGLVDPLDDTPSCPDMMGDWEDCPDWDYIMFPSGGSGGNLFSPLQAKVIQGGALYRGVFAPGEPPMPPYGPALPTPPDAGGNARLVGAAELAAARARVSSRAARKAGAWSSALPRGAARHLEGLGCAQGLPSGTDFFSTLEDLGGLDAHALAAVAQDTSAPAHVRRRALIGLGRLAERGEAVPLSAAALERLAADGTERSLVRIGALRALRGVDGARASALSRTLRGDADRVVASVAKRAK